MLLSICIDMVLILVVAIVTFPLCDLWVFFPTQDVIKFNLRIIIIIIITLFFKLFSQRKLTVSLMFREKSVECVTLDDEMGRRTWRIKNVGSG
jgi:hypothetical protein